MGISIRGIVGIAIAVLVFSSVASIGLFSIPSHASLAIPTTATIVTHNPGEVSASIGDTLNDSIRAFVYPGPIAPMSDLSDTAGADPVIKYNVITDKKNELGEHPVLMENSSAHDPTYKELLNFLKNDDTVKNKYVSPNFTCADFAQEMQNHAESQGIRCGFSGISFLNAKYGHAMSVFETTDMGLIYVDTTSGKVHISKNIYPGARYDNMGVICNVKNYW